MLYAGSSGQLLVELHVYGLHFILYCRAWLAVSRAIMTTVGLGSKFILSGMNTTIIHGREHLEVTRIS